jgi:hypothetical protein
MSLKERVKMTMKRRKLICAPSFLPKSKGAGPDPLYPLVSRREGCPAGSGSRQEGRAGLDGDLLFALLRSGSCLLRAPHTMFLDKFQEV